MTSLHLLDAVHQIIIYLSLEIQWPLNFVITVVPTEASMIEKPYDQGWGRVF